ncbi:hypothetical protein CRE_09090 [Caenorhabditis remanei]|uniref:SPK domain-containing protein n=1 Tax=Caenorhabditis remanei TaxID=31234 RepID=E3LJ71_CAERE|nr:hypothetical protein CRE_09090 [Caenorhabditis remanei]
MSHTEEVNTPISNDEVVREYCDSASTISTSDVRKRAVIEKELYEKEMNEMIDYISEISKDPVQPISMGQLGKDFKARSGSKESANCLRVRISRYRSKIHELDSVDKNTKVKMLFVLGAPVPEEFLNELRQDAVVEVDDSNRIAMYKANDGTLDLQREDIPNERIRKQECGQTESKAVIPSTKTVSGIEEKEQDKKVLVTRSGRVSKKRNLSISDQCDAQISSQKRSCISSSISYLHSDDGMDKAMSSGDPNGTQRSVVHSTAEACEDSKNVCNDSIQHEEDDLELYSRIENDDEGMEVPKKKSRRRRRKPNTDVPVEEQEETNAPLLDETFHNQSILTSDEKNIELMNFFIERSIHAVSPVKMYKLCTEYKKEMNCDLAVLSIYHRIKRLLPVIHLMEDLDIDTKIKMVFLLSAPIDPDFLFKLREHAEVKIDDRQRIIEYTRNGGGLELKGTHSAGNREVETKEKAIMMFLEEKSKTVDTPMQPGSLLKEFQESTGTKDARTTLDRLYKSVRNNIYWSPDFDKITKAKMMFISSSRVPECFLKELREIAFVEVDEANIILKFKVDDGSVEFSGDPSFSAKMRALWFHRKSVGVMNSTVEIENEESENNDTELVDEHEEREAADETVEDMNESFVMRSGRVSRKRVPNKSLFSDDDDSELAGKKRSNSYAPVSKMMKPPNEDSASASSGNTSKPELVDEQKPCQIEESSMKSTDGLCEASREQKSNNISNVFDDSVQNEGNYVETHENDDMDLSVTEYDSRRREDESDPSLMDITSIDKDITSSSHKVDDSHRRLEESRASSSHLTHPKTEVVTRKSSVRPISKAQKVSDRPLKSSVTSSPEATAYSSSSPPSNEKMDTVRKSSESRSNMTSENQEISSISEYMQETYIPLYDSITIDPMIVDHEEVISDTEYRNDYSNHQSEDSNHPNAEATEDTRTVSAIDLNSIESDEMPLNIRKKSSSIESKRRSNRMNSETTVISVSTQTSNLEPAMEKSKPETCNSDCEIIGVFNDGTPAEPLENLKDFFKLLRAHVSMLKTTNLADLHMRIGDMITKLGDKPVSIDNIRVSLETCFLSLIQKGALKSPPEEEWRSLRNLMVSLKTITCFFEHPSLNSFKEKLECVIRDLSIQDKRITIDEIRSALERTLNFVSF